MQNKKATLLLVGLLITWLIVNLLQAIFTEIIHDEAYYALYGEHLSWGYFDHPPMVGLMTFISNYFCDGSLSVRLITVLLSTCTLLVLWRLVADKDTSVEKVQLFFIISASMVMVNAYGFITTPDAPLLFFTATFLLAYKQFIIRETRLSALILGLAMAGMIYSKYHGLLIIGLIVLSNPKLLIRFKFWAAGSLAIFFLIPHIQWQFDLEFPSLKYHLIDRSTGFKWNYFFEYWPNQLAVFNPFTLGAFFYAIAKSKFKKTFDRGLIFLSVGFLLFFWAMTYKGHAEPHWTVAASIPMIILIYKLALINEPFKRYIKRFVLPSILLILIMRIILVTDILPYKLGFHSKEKQYRAIEKVAGNLPVVFFGSFQNASLYHYFTGKEAFVISSVESRQTQFDIWMKELAYTNQAVFVCQKNNERSKNYKYNGIEVNGFKAEHLQTVNRLNLEFEINEKTLKSGQKLQIPIELVNSYRYDINFKHAEFPISFKAVYIKGKETHTIDCQRLNPTDNLESGNKLSDTLSTYIPDLPKGKYQFGISMFNTLSVAQNSIFVPIEIK